MNYAIRLGKHLPKGMEIQAPHPDTGETKTGIVQGTWAEDRIGAFDQGAYVIFDGENTPRQISSKLITRPNDR